MSNKSRQAILIRWQTILLNDLVQKIQDIGRQYNLNKKKLDRIFAEKNIKIIKNKKIIICTTNGAAKYFSTIQTVLFDVVFVEEIDEILKIHILIFLKFQTEQFIMIENHKQLRSNCSYKLNVKQDDDFDSNRSFFERFVFKDFLHVTLTQQHRMKPEISSMICHLIYFELINTKSILNRVNLRDFCDNVIFVNHFSSKTELKNEKKFNDDKTFFKQNELEGQIILKCVYYLTQQRYESDKIVVITPYFDQLKFLKNWFFYTNDFIFNDLNKIDLIRVKLFTNVSFKSFKSTLRISIIDEWFY